MEPEEKTLKHPRKLHELHQKDISQANTDISLI